MTSPRASLERAGIDTWSPCWYVGDDSPAARAMRSLATAPAARGSFLMPGDVAGYRVGWFPGQRLVFAEGHPAGDGELAPVRSLPAALARLVVDLGDVGVPVPVGNARRPWRGSEMRPGFAGLRRLDIAADLRFAKPRHGTAALEAVAAISPPRGRHSVRYGVDGRVETVYVHGYSRMGVLARVYDKGRQAHSAKPGEVIRLEDQRRWQSGRRPVVDGEPATVHQLFGERFAYTARAPTVTVGGLTVLTERVHELVAAGTITERRAERVLGHLLAQAGGMPGFRSRATETRRRAEVRELGLVLARLPGAKRQDLDLRSLFEPALGPGGWDAIEAQAAAR